MVVLANMQNITPVGKLLFQVWQNMSLRRKHQFILLLVLMILASFAEIMSIGSVIPFLSALTSPENFFINPLTRPLIAFLGIENANQLIIPLTIVFCLSAIYNTIVCERGVRLSGGQRQRIGIARELYKNADILVFGEAISALDNKTEDSVMKSIEALGKEITVIMIAHRTTTLKKCTKIIKLTDGKIVNIVSYRDIINSSH